MNAIASGARRTLLERREALERLARLETPDAQKRRGVLDQAAEVETALARIEAGNYGLCESCEGAIGRLRLRAIPEARLCMACSARRVT